jgi:Tol biopolymer transport system component
MIQHSFLKLFILMTCLSASSVWAAETIARLPDLQPHELAFYSRHEGNFEIYLADADREIVVNLTRSPDQDTRPAWSSDGTQIAFYSARGRSDKSGIYVMDADGGHPQWLAQGGLSEAYPAWSPDGHSLAYSSEGRDNTGVYKVDVDSGRERLIYDEYTALLSYSPDGRRMVFMSACDNHCDIFVMDADGENVRRLTHNGLFDMFPTWSPDSQEIAFMSNRDQFFELYVMDADCPSPVGECSRVTRLSDNRDFDGFPVWSPDGRKLLFSTDRNGNFDLYTVDVRCADKPGGCEQSARQLTNQPRRDLSPAWSADGREIAFISGRDVYVMDADGSHLRHIMDDVLPDQFLAWRP